MVRPAADVFNWSRRRDSNPEPAVYKTAALPIELRRQGAGEYRSRLRGAAAIIGGGRDRGQARPARPAQSGHPSSTAGVRRRAGGDARPRRPPGSRSGRRGRPASRARRPGAGSVGALTRRRLGGATLRGRPPARRAASPPRRQDRARDGGVERRDPAAHRDPDQEVAAAPDRRRRGRAPRSRRRARAARAGRPRGRSARRPRRLRRSAGPGGGGRRARPAGRRPARGAGARLAPADALTAAGLSGAWRRVGNRTPSTPAASALRSSEPRFWGSSSESSTSTNGGSPRPIARARMSSGAANRRASTTSATPW